MGPLISICLPNYNYEKFLREAIESVLSQTYTNFELIISDNASTDSSVEIIKEYNDPRIRFFQNDENIPLYQNINKCVAIAQGELIAIIHSDDKYEPNFIEEIVNAYLQYPDQKVFVTGVNIWHFEKNTILPLSPYPKGGIVTKGEIMVRLAQENNIGNGVNVAFHRGCLKKTDIFLSKYKYASDYDLWFRLADHFDFVYIPKILAYYRIHASNLSHKVIRNLDMFKEGISIFTENITNCKTIPKNLKPHLNYIQYGTTLYKSFDMGIKYKSGEVSRNMLKYVAKIYPEIKINPYWYGTYLLTYLINEKLPANSIKYISYIGKIVLYPYKANLRSTIERMVNNINEAIA